MLPHYITLNPRSYPPCHSVLVVALRIGSGTETMLCYLLHCWKGLPSEEQRFVVKQSYREGAAKELYKDKDKHTLLYSQTHIHKHTCTCIAHTHTHTLVLVLVLPQQELATHIHTHTLLLLHYSLSVKDVG